MGITIYLIAAIAVAVMVAGAGYKGYGLGQDNMRAEYAAAVEKARTEAEAKRQAEEVKARQLAQNLQTSLAKQRKLANDLGTSLQAHIRAIPKPPAGCPEPRLTDGLLSDVNRALAGAEGAPGTGLPPASGTTTPTDRPNNAGAGAVTR